MAIVWTTPAGSLGNIAKGEPCNVAISCSGANSFSIIAGNLPIGLTITGPFNQPSLPFPSIWGSTSVDAITGLSTFTIRASTDVGNISDRAFSFNVLDQEPSYLFPNSDLGIFPDGQYLYSTVAPLTATPNWPTNMTIVSGSLPDQLVLNPETGDITGYVSPVVLYDSGFIYPNKEAGKPNLPHSANSRTYDFTVQYDAQNTADFSLTIQRQDLFNNANANVSGPVYHDPIFLDATFGLNVCSSDFANINLGVVDGDSILYQFRTEDFEDNTLNYLLINGDAIPGNVTINPITGWLSGYINRDLTLPTPYEFQVIAYKSANVFTNSHLQTTAFCTLTVENPADNSIVWDSQNNLGNLFAGVPSSLDVHASIIEPFTAPSIQTATANCTLKLVGVEIINGGNAFANGSIFTVPGGISANSANIIVSNVSASGTITEVTIDPTIVQEYTKLPDGLTVIWTNSTGNANALNAIFGLDFGVDQVNILTRGGFYDTATVGFEPAGESVTATAEARIFNGTLSNVIVDTTGHNYQAIPKVTILGRSRITPTNPIKYELTGGTIPAGCQLLSNGLIVGLPSSQYFSMDQTTIVDQNQTIFDRTFDFTVTASIGQNRPIDFTETDLSGANVVTENFQTLIQVTRDFTLNLKTTIPNSITAAPPTNLSLEFLLGDTDMNTLFTPLNDESIVSNDDIFRQDDFYFGIAQHVRMLLAYGISPEIPDTIQEAIERYFHNKKYLFNGLKWARSSSEGYEVIYIEPLDEFTNTSYQTFSGPVSYNTPAGPKNAFPATLPNMIHQLNTHLNGFDYNFLPSWMRDIQPDGQILGFVPAIPLLYCKPGTGKRIMFYLQQYYNTIGPAVETIDAITDRLVWNAGYSQNWDPRPRVTLVAKNITAQISAVTVSGSNANYAVIETNTGNAVPAGTQMVIQGMTNANNNGKFPVVSSTPVSFLVNNANGISETTSAGYAYSLNLTANSSFTINPAAPIAFAPDLTPRTYSYTGNIVVNLPSNIADISNVAAIINSYDIQGIQAGIGADNELYIQNITGSPFILYDGNNTPLANLGLLPTGNAFANVNVVIVAGWWSSELTQFDQGVPDDDLTTESSFDLTTENCIVIITEGTTNFTDIGTFFDTSDVFLNDDDGAIYIKFPNSSFINPPVVGV